jgi:hypothetical protein
VGGLAPAAAARRRRVTAAARLVTSTVDAEKLARGFAAGGALLDVVGSPGLPPPVVNASWLSATIKLPQHSLDKATSHRRSTHSKAHGRSSRDLRRNPQIMLGWPMIISTETTDELVAAFRRAKR